MSYREKENSELLAESMSSRHQTRLLVRRPGRKLAQPLNVPYQQVEIAPAFVSCASRGNELADSKKLGHWQFRLDDDGSYSIHGVPAGMYRMFVNLFEPPEDGCLAAPIAMKALDVVVPQLHESIELPIVAMEASSLLKIGDVVPDFEYLKLEGRMSNSMI